jgi:hypothetical protein
MEEQEVYETSFRLIHHDKKTEPLGSVFCRHFTHHRLASCAGEPDPEVIGVR